MKPPFPNVDVEPAKEVWVPHEKTDAEGVAEATQEVRGRGEAAAERRAQGPKAWGRKKVFKDVQSRAAGFAPAEREQWQTLKEFHERHECSDTVPTVPFNMHGATKAWPITHGSPINWHVCWSTLSWVFARPHQPATAAAAVTALAIAGGEEGTAVVATQEPAVINERTLALANITGTNAPKSTRRAAEQAEQIVQAAAALDQHLVSVLEGGLYFVHLAEGIIEGEFKVGLARATESKSVKEGEAASQVQVKVKWYARNEWLGSKRQWEWSPGPSFKPAKVPGTNRMWYTPEPLSCFLPVPVQLTPAALQSGREETPKLLAGCVKLLRETCVTRGLIANKPLALTRKRGRGEGIEGESEEEGEIREQEEQRGRERRGILAQPRAASEGGAVSRSVRAARREMAKQHA